MLKKSLVRRGGLFMTINFRDIPSVSKLMEHRAGKKLIATFGRQDFLLECRSALDSIRQQNHSYSGSLEIEVILSTIEDELSQKTGNKLKRVINCTGTLLHTNLGRAPLAGQVGEILKDISTGYSNLEFDLQKGERGSRTSGIENQLRTILGVEDCAIVNNNAAAVLLVLMAITKGKEVIISRGQLVEIGGSFRVPEIMEQSGSILKEVGTTNKVHLQDYENAINEKTGAIMRVHPSNYRVMGFTKELSLKELSELAKRHNLPLIDDLGSGTILGLGKWGIHDEPTVNESLEMGGDIVTFSGDKLLGGPQCGVIIGKKEYIAKIKKHPLMRALRCDKLVLSTLQYTLDLYKKEKIDEIPLYKFLNREISELTKLAVEITKVIPQEAYEIIEDYAYVGGGALPTQKLPTVIIKLKGHYSAQILAKWFREQTVPIIGRINQDQFILDMKAVFNRDVHDIQTTLEKVWGELND